MTSWHRVGQSIASGPQLFFFFRALEPENLWLKRVQFQMENPCFLGTLEWFFMIYAGTKIPPVFQTPICETFHTHTHTYLAYRPKFSNPGGRDLVPRSSLICKWWLGDSIHQLPKSFGSFTQMVPQNWRMFCATPMVDGKKRQHFFGTLDTSWAVLP